MRVQTIDVFRVRIPLRKPIKHASHVRRDTENLVVRVALVDGTTGWGEGVPRDYVTGETIEESVALLRKADLKLFQSPCATFEEAVKLCDSFALPAAAGDERLCFGNAARCAVELALLDAYGRQFGRPLADVTGILAPELHQSLPRVQYSGVITSARGWKARTAALIMRLYGFKQLKIKVGIPGYDDPSRLEVIRRRVGAKMDIRVDANEAWTPAEACARIQALEPFGISAIEQPMPHEHAGSLADLRRHIRTPIMLDESLCSELDARRAAEGGLCDIFNLRLSKCGGFTRSLRLAQYAKRHGLSCQLGCQVGETAILSAAGRHFATSVAGLRYLEGSYDRRLVHEALGKQDLTFGWGGWAPRLNGAGLGVDIDEAALKRVEFNKERLLA
jgi:L-Ala-D/L-Glu epimerase